MLNGSELRIWSYRPQEEYLRTDTVAIESFQHFLIVAMSLAYGRTDYSMMGSVLLLNTSIPCQVYSNHSNHL